MVRSLENWFRDSRRLLPSRVFKKRAKRDARRRSLSIVPQIKKLCSILSPWLEEIAYVATSVALITTLVIILRVYDGRQLTDWQGAISAGNYSVNISLDFIVAVLGTISKAAIAVSVEAGLSQSKWVWFTQSRPLSDYKKFDYASRGPLGSARLLATTKVRFVLSSLQRFLISTSAQRLCFPGCNHRHYWVSL